MHQHYNGEAGMYGDASARRERRKRRYSPSAMIYDLLIDMGYLLLTAFGATVILWLLYFVCFEMQPLTLIRSAVRTIETYFWTSVFLVCLFGVLTVEMLERQRRQRKAFWRVYDDDARYRHSYY